MWQHTFKSRFSKAWKYYHRYHCMPNQIFLSHPIEVRYLTYFFFCITIYFSILNYLHVKHSIKHKQEVQICWCNSSLLNSIHKNRHNSLYLRNLRVKESISWQLSHSTLHSTSMEIAIFSWVKKIFREWSVAGWIKEIY